MTLKVTFEQEGCLERIEKEVRGEKHRSIAQRVGQRAAWNPSQLSQILNVHHPLIMLLESECLRMSSSHTFHRLSCCESSEIMASWLGYGVNCDVKTGSQFILSPIYL